MFLQIEGWPLARLARYAKALVRQVTDSGSKSKSEQVARYRASGLNLVVAAITLWKTVYLQRAAEALARSRPVDQALFQHVSPLGWEHVNLTGDYTWHTNKRVAKGG